MGYIKKLTKEEFLELKNKMSDLYDEFYFKNNNHMLEEEFLSKYKKYQEELLSYDLSEIPSIEWYNFYIVSSPDYIADFSKTKANLDFYIMDVHYGNYKNCNVINIDRLGKYVDEDSFDEDIIKNNPKIFLSDDFSQEFKHKFYKSKLVLNDFLDLTEEQINELKAKDVMSHLDINTLTIRTLKDRAIDLYRYSKEDYKYVDFIIGYYLTKTDKSIGYNIDIYTCDIKELKKICNDTFIESLFYANGIYKDTYLNPSIYDGRFVKENPDLFMTNVEMPDELRKAYYCGEIIFVDVLKNYEIFKNINISYLRSTDNTIRNFLHSISDDNFKYLMDNHIDVLEHFYHTSYGIRELADDIEYIKSSGEKSNEIFMRSFIKAVKKYIIKENQYTCGVKNRKKYVILPDWCKSLHFKAVHKYDNFEEMKQYDDNTVVINYVDRILAKYFNIDYIKKFEEETGFFTKLDEDKIVNPHSTNLSNLIKNRNEDYWETKNLKDIAYDDFLIYMRDQFVENKILGNTILYYDFIEGNFKEKFPEIFLDDKAPKELKDIFYRKDSGWIDFELLQENKEWIPFLKNKEILSCFSRNHSIEKYETYFKIFGSEKGLILGAKKPELVDEVVDDNKMELMYSWYEKSGFKFVPDRVVMYNFPLEEYDNFINAGPKWSSLMKIKNFSSMYEEREAMFKLAYCFGVFHNDQRGYKTLLSLLNDIPHNIPKDKTKDIYNVDLAYFSYYNLRTALIEEGFTYDNDTQLFDQIYPKKKDGSRTLSINLSDFPKSSALIRDILIKTHKGLVLAPEEAHRLFGGFKVKYDPDFREFLLKNLYTILNDNENSKHIANIQRQFDEIKAFNSNRGLTYDLALSYIKTNAYKNIDIGNYEAAEIISQANYSQEDFDILQKIYNYGKERIYSSIPRISESYDNYTYEILKLNDPLALVVGVLTDCCQELDDTAEACMEHSMTSSDGRVFVIKDFEGNIVAQSWVWRNKNVLCFDNIEIPEKAFKRAYKNGISNNNFADIVYDMYKKAAQKLLEIDEITYKKLLEEEKITKEEYEENKLTKITVGKGYNDIATSLRKNANIDLDIISRPLPYELPVPLNRALYTNDSLEQYILEKSSDYINKGRGHEINHNIENMAVYNDDYIEYSKDNFDVNKLLMLKNLEVSTTEDRYNTDIEDNENIISEIARNYYMDPEKTKIILDPNFAIIYEDNNNHITINDLFYNTLLSNNNENIIEEQISLALNQISKDKKIELGDINDKGLEMYNNIVNKNIKNSSSK